jgi:exodeoxyribonuclease V alpha subunit
VSALTPLGTAKARFLREQGLAGARGDDGLLAAVDAEDIEPSYLGWEIARCARGLAGDEKRALAALAAACVAAMQAGSTRLPLDGPRLGAALALVGASDSAAAIRSLVARVREGGAVEGVAAVIGRAGERKPLVVDGEWLYAERMRVLEERFCARVRERVARPAAGAADTRATSRAVAAVVAGPPPLTDEQKKAVREALGGSLALVTGGPGTGKTTIVVALLRALAWTGVPMEAVAIAAPTGKAAQRLSEAISAGLAAAPRDIAEAGLRAIAPAPQTLHRLLGWSPSTGRFARHENDRLPHRVVVVDEASMIDLAMMDRLLRALRDDARLVLLGDADQLPSVEAGAVFRDLCAGLGAARLTQNLRVARDPNARRIVAAARAVNAGVLDRSFADAVTTRRAVEELTFEGVEHLAAPWEDVGEVLLARWWEARVAALDGFARRIARTYRLRAGCFDDEDAAELRALFAHHARTRLLCATRVRGFATGAEAINDRLLARLRGGAPHLRRAGRAASLAALAPGAPVLVERNDYERQLFNGDQGIVVRVDTGGAEGVQPSVVFPRGERLDVFPLEALPDLAPAFAMTVHKAQGSEFDDVALVLPEGDMPLLTRELLYTAITRARRSVLIVGEANLLARAVSRTLERHSGVAERLGKTPR